MDATACTSATSPPAPTAAARPAHGLPVAWVIAAAVNAPASIMPSSAMLMTPDRSENSPPNAARMRGVDRRIVEEISAIVKRSAIALVAPKRSAKAENGFTKKSFRGEEQNDRPLKNLHDIFSHVLRKRVHRHTAAREHRKQHRREDDTHRMV